MSDISQMSLEELKQKVDAYRRGHFGMTYVQYAEAVNKGEITNFSYADMAMWKEFETVLTSIERKMY